MKIGEKLLELGKKILGKKDDENKVEVDLKESDVNEEKMTTMSEPISSWWILYEPKKPNIFK